MCAKIIPERLEMKTEILYDQGSATHAEDTAIFHPPFFYGVADGVSGIYHPTSGPKLLNGKTGGQVVVSLLSRTLATATPDTSFLEVLCAANAAVMESNAEEMELSPDEPECLPAAAFAIARIGSANSVELMQGGDSLAVWRNRDGTVGATPNPMFNYESELNTNSRRLLESGKSVRKMWQKHLPFYARKRRKALEQGCSVISGLLNAKQHWRRFMFPNEKLSLLILFTDGLVTLEETRKPRALAKRILSSYDQGGLGNVLKETRAALKEVKTYEKRPEATAIAIQF